MVNRGIGCFKEELKLVVNFSSVYSWVSPNINIDDTDVGHFKA